MSANRDKAKKYQDLEHHDERVAQWVKDLEEFNGRVPFDDKIPNVKRLAEFLAIEHEYVHETQPWD